MRIGFLRKEIFKSFTRINIKNLTKFSKEMNLDELIPYLKQLEPEKCFRSEFEQDAYIEIRYSSAKNLFEVRIERPDYMDKPDIEVNEYTEERLRNIFSSKLASS